MELFVTFIMLPALVVMVVGTVLLYRDVRRETVKIEKLCADLKRKGERP